MSDIDVTFMYAVHDAFQRDLERLHAMAGGAHGDHEERDALPLVRELLTAEEWAAFGDEHRHRLGVKGAASFFPWLLDGADAAMRRRVLGVVPPPVRVLHRFVWSPRYRRAPRWHAPVGA